MDRQFAPEYDHSVKLSYLAGIIDGEGSINLLAKPSTQQIQLRLQVANTSTVLIDWLQSGFGGKVYEHKMHSTYHKQRYDWVVTGKEAKKLIKVVLPFLIVKKMHATLALEFPILTPGLQHNSVIHEIRSQMVAEMKELNR